VSLLERIGRGHLSDRRIADLWTSEASDPHLAACGPCRERYAAFEHWADDIAQELRADADNTMSAERYALQQAQIARRLETLDRPPRVIAFPKAARTVMGGHTHVGRWLAAGVAAGLLAGVGLGQVVPGLINSPGHIREQIVQPEMTSSRATGRANTIKPASATFDDTQLLSDTFVDSRVKDLRPIDDMTPHIRDIFGK
jgi:hypothetical protein